jgi:hypothetical protein
MKKSNVKIAVSLLFVAAVGMNFALSNNSTWKNNSICLSDLLKQSQASTVCEDYDGGDASVCCLSGSGYCAADGEHGVGPIIFL